MSNQIAPWPSSSRVSPQSLITQFTIDVLITYLGQKNPAFKNSDPLWQRAVLIEVSENRHAGNKYTVAQVGGAVKSLQAAIAKIAS
jgi:hypothetical protein